MTPDGAQGKHDRTDRANAESSDVCRRPYDTTELDKVPRPTDEDPPYRPWWVL